MSAQGKKAPESLSLRGLRAAPAQLWGAARVVPLVRERPRGDLRVATEEGALVTDQGHALVALHGVHSGWREGAPTVTYGTQLLAPGNDRRRAQPPLVVRLDHAPDALRPVGSRARVLGLLPSMEGLLLRYLDAPGEVWSAYARQQPVRGTRRVHLPSLDEASRVFEAHDGQCGLLVFAGDTLVAALVVPHPDDYLALQRAWFEDLLAETLALYGRREGRAPSLELALEGRALRSLDDLRAALERTRVSWTSASLAAGEGLFPRALRARSAGRLGPWTTWRFATQLTPSAENHLGEAVLWEDGEVMALVAWRLSEAQVRRAYLLEQLALRDWDLERAAPSLRNTRDELLVRLEGAGFRYVLKTLARAVPRGRLG